ncbi:hypothetical protein D3230_09500 [Leucobacter chromiireducens subsp. solipictus]|uniref:Schlafen AlbA-2 domain-containing protein n=2 Tax=Leucobacter TaxID=55968 RepID=A0ABS1SGD2_9MICO|nr:hypothetical protein [Leucobacter chromiireducens subsp. solipictus]
MMVERRDVDERVLLTDHSELIPEEARETDRHVSLLSKDDLLIAQASASCSLEPNISHLDMLSLVSPLAAAHGVTIHSLGQSYFLEEYDGGDVSYWNVDSSQLGFEEHDYLPEPVLTDFDGAFRHVRLSAPDEMPLKNFLDVAHSISLLMGAFTGGQPTAEGVLHLVKNNRADLLVGLPESNWFEIKEGLYQFTHPQVPEKTKLAQKVEFAQDVASFANSGKSAVIVLGIKEASEDLPNLLAPQKVPPQFRKSAFDVLDARVYPPLEGVQIELSSTQGRQFVAVYIPAQDETKLPFLVRGTVVADLYEDTFISIPRRRGETKISQSVEEFHSQVQAGRAFLHFQESRQ